MLDHTQIETLLRQVITLQGFTLGIVLSTALAQIVGLLLMGIMLRGITAQTTRILEITAQVLREGRTR